MQYRSIKKCYSEILQSGFIYWFKYHLNFYVDLAACISVEISKLSDDETEHYTIISVNSCSVYSHLKYMYKHLNTVDITCLILTRFSYEYFFKNDAID